MAQPEAQRFVGQRLPRIEDERLLLGKGRYVADIALPDTLHVAFVRSPHAHALIRSIDKTTAMALPGVFAVIAAPDIERMLDRLRLPLGFPTTELPDDITPFVLTPKEACFVGEPVVMVLASSRYIAEDGAGAVVIDWEPLPALADCRLALDPNGPKVRLEAPDNVLKRLTVAYGDCGRVFGEAPHVFAENIHQHRGGAHPMEGRGIVASVDEGRDELLVWSSTQMAHEVQYTIARMLGLEDSQVRSVTPDVGGGFGAKFLVYPEEVAVAAAAWHFRRPVKWVEDRAEHFVSAIQERDQYWDMEVAADDHGKILGIRGRLIHDQGAYTPQGINCAYNAATGVTGPYKIPNYHLDVNVAQTNKVYVIPLRGAGYPEGAFVMERLLDRVAMELDLDRAFVRAQNLVPAEALPYQKPLKARSGKHIILDTGDYHEAQGRALKAIDYEGFPVRKAVARQQGRYIGIGLANAVKGTGRGPFESGAVKISASGHVLVRTGAAPMGQGLNTALAQIAAEALNVPLDLVKVTSGDATVISMGVGGFASRQTITAGSSVHFAAVAVAAKLRTVGAYMLKVEPYDVLLEGGAVCLKADKTKRASFAEVARLLRGVAGYDLPPGVGAGLESTQYWEPTDMTYAGAFHACEVEVDVGTGDVTILRYVAVHDSGTLINPMLAEGQVHGGIVHGIGNALFEFMRYDEQAQPTTSTFADYLLPTSTEVPRIELSFMTSPAPSNPIGVKGIGEAGTIPVTSTIISAIDDALSEYKVHLTSIPVDPVMLLGLIERNRT